jgi:hypothetical protein
MRHLFASAIVVVSAIGSARAADEDNLEAAKNTLQAVDGPSATSTGPSNATKTSAQASGNTSQGSAQLSHLWAVGNRSALGGNLMAAAPFSGDSAPKADVGSVSTLAAGINSRVDASWILLPKPRPERQIDAITTDYNEICDSFIAKALGSDYYYNPTEARRAKDPQSLNALALFKDSPACAALTSPSKFSAFVKSANAEIDSRNKQTTPKLPLELPLALKSGWRSEAKLAKVKFEKLMAQYPAQLNSFGLSFLGNSHSYSWVAKAAPTKIVKQTDEGYGFGPTYARVLDGISLIAGFSYERPYQGGQGQQICSPIGATTSTSCTTASVGAPTKGISRIYSFEIRAVIVKGFAIAPRLEYDQASANYGINLPVYFVPNAQDILNGGLEFGWTKANRFQGAVVIQKAFNFLN